MRWNTFWFAEGGTLALGLFRIAFAGCLWREVDTTMNKSVFALADEYFHLPYASFIPLVPEAWWGPLHAVEFVLITLLALGLFHRTAAASLLLLEGWVFFADQMNFRNHPYFFLLVLAALSLAPASDAVSIPALFRAARRGRGALLGGRRPLTWQRLLQVQVAMVYVFAAAHKFNPFFLGGHVLSHYLVDSAPEEADYWMELSPDALDRMRLWLADPAHLIGPSVVSAVLELTLPFGLFVPRLRPWALLIGVPFHLGIAFSMNIWAFSWAMIASYLLFLDPDRLVARARRHLLGLPAV
jgi:hypothetical protein